jgi:hypothetical protein
MGWEHLGQRWNGNGEITSGCAAPEVVGLQWHELIEVLKAWIEAMEVLFE